MVQRAYREYSSKGFQAIGVAVDQFPQNFVPDFVRKYNLTFPVGWASIEDICRLCDVKPEQLFVPSMLFFDRKGKQRFKYMSGDPAFFTMEENNLKNTIELLLKEPAR